MKRQKNNNFNFEGEKNIKYNNNKKPHENVASVKDFIHFPFYLFPYLHICFILWLINAFFFCNIYHEYCNTKRFPPLDLPYLEKKTNGSLSNTFCTVRD